MAVQTVESVVNELMSAIEEGYTHSALTRALSQLAVIVEDQDYRLLELEQHAVEQVDHSVDIEKRQRKLARKLKKLKDVIGDVDDDLQDARESVAELGAIGRKMIEMKGDGDKNVEAVLNLHDGSISNIAEAHNIMASIVNELIEKHNGLVVSHNLLMQIAKEAIAEEEE